MSDFETHPRGTAARIAELEADLTKVRRRETILIDHMTEVISIAEENNTNTLLEGVVNHCLEELKGVSNEK